MESLLSPGVKVHGFIVQRVEEIPELRSKAIILRHERTGAGLLHLFNEDSNNLFAIAFRTPVSDHTGVPHILEHAVLCGSRKYPIREPFVELMKGSLATFLNAFTYPDRTVYPVASQVEADFFNLVDVYCDAVFDPLLTEDSFYQEGWHFALESPSGPIDIKGVVYSEMKGVFSDFQSHVARRGLSTLLPDTTYGYESGGDPDSITNLTYQRFLDFHRRFYHPSNARIFLYGNIPTERTLRFLEENHLHRFSSLDIDSRIWPQRPFDAPRRADFFAPAPEEDEGTATIFVSWIFGDAKNPEDRILGLVLERYLLGTSSSPLKRALIDSRMGEDLSSNSGFDPSILHTTFTAGLRRTRPEEAEKLRDLIFSTLESQVRDGLDPDLLEGSLRRTEFQLREISGSSRFPYPIILMERCLESWIYDGDPISHLRFESTLGSIRRKADEEPPYFARQIRERFLENRHHVLVTVRASSAEARKMEESTRIQVEKLTKGFDEQRKREIHLMTIHLLEEQRRPPSPEAIAKIPRIKKRDLPPRNKEVPTEIQDFNGSRAYIHPIFSGGIVYFAIGFPIEFVPSERIPYLPLFVTLLSRAGAAGLDFKKMANRISLATGGIHGSTVVQSHFLDRERVQSYAFFTGKCLSPRFGEMMEIFRDLLISADLHNEELFKEILDECKNGLRSSVLQHGHIFATRRAAATILSSEALSERLHGIEQLHFLESISSCGPLHETFQSFEEIRDCLLCRQDVVISLTSEEPERHTKVMEELICALPLNRKSGEKVSFRPIDMDRPQFWEINSAVNYVAMAIPVLSPLDLGLYYLICKLLSTGYLWNKIRLEGGAYGAFASVSAFQPVFTLASYRDPGLFSTIEHFENGLSEIARGLSEEELERGIIGTIGSYDRPRVPEEEGFHETMALLAGLDRDIRQRIREDVLEAKAERISSIAMKVIESRPRRIAVIGPKSSVSKEMKDEWFIGRI